MMQMFWIILACGVGTFLLRWLPLRQARKRHTTERGSAAVVRLLAGVGPAAVSALFTVSIYGLLGTEHTLNQFFRIVSALAIVVMVRMLTRGGVAIPTLCGALGYGLLGTI
ncbi:AzlD domain-containing protein [Ectopseudomonas mendocina]|uniref:AzlD domain-containing protein n=1 Tax=Ectopseudomonas mendocina TaxID=300 RepID=A0ABZ2RB33_ECTME